MADITVQLLAIELAKLVQQGKGDLKIVLSSDSEGNSYDKIGSIGLAVAEEGEWGLEIVADLKENTKIKKGQIKTLVLYPN